MTPYQIALTVIVVLLGTVLMLLVMRRNARRAIEKRDAHIILGMQETQKQINKIRLDTIKRINNKYPRPSQKPIETRRRTEDDYVGPVMYPMDFDAPHHHNHCDPTPDSNHGSSDSWGDSSSSDSSSSDSGGGDSGGGDGGGGD